MTLLSPRPWLASLLLHLLALLLLPFCFQRAVQPLEQPVVAKPVVGVTLTPEPPRLAGVRSRKLSAGRSSPPGAARLSAASSTPAHPSTRSPRSSLPSQPRVTSASPPPEVLQKAPVAPPSAATPLQLSPRRQAAAPSRATDPPPRVPSVEVVAASEAQTAVPTARRPERKPAVSPGASAALPAEAEAGGEGGLLLITPPILIRGPERIEIPEWLQSRSGQVELALRCDIGADGSSRVTVLQGSGVVDLDEAVRSAFSGLPWYPAERAGRPVPLAVRLIVNSRWDAGDRFIPWGRRVPPVTLGLRQATP